MALCLPCSVGLYMDLLTNLRINANKKTPIIGVFLFGGAKGIRTLARV